MANTLVKGLAIGCGALMLLIGGLAIVGGITYNRMSLEMQQEALMPPDRVALLAALKDIPIYPGAEFNAPVTQGAVVAKKLLGLTMKDPVAVGFKLPVSKDVAAWYEKTLPEKGYTKTGDQHFKRGSRELIVIPMTTSGEDFITLIVGEAK